MRKLILVLVALVLPLAARANGYYVPNVSPRDLGMAGSAVAAQDGAGAVFENPAALARLNGLYAAAAGSLLDFRSTWTAVDGSAKVGSNTSLVTPVGLYASYSGRLKDPDLGYGFGVGFTVPGGGNVVWPNGWPGRFDIVSVDRRIYGTYLAAAVEPIRWARLGGSFIWYRGTEHLVQQLGYPGAETTGEVGTAGNGFAYDVSLELQPIAPLRIAFDYKHKGTMKLTGQAHFSNTPPELAGNLQDQGVTHDLVFPNVIDTGVAFQVLPELLATFEFSWYRFIVYDRDVFAGDRGFTLAVGRNYHNSQTYRLGLEYSGFSRLRLRAGVARNNSPTAPEWMSPTIPDADVWAVAGGLSYEIAKGLNLDVAYYHDFFDQVNTTVGGANNVFPGIYDTRANILSLGLSWNLPAGG
jgi:long-chain fatty acid transport protein